MGAISFQSHFGGYFSGFLPVLDVGCNVCVHIFTDKPLEPVVTGLVKWVVVLRVPCWVCTGDVGGESGSHTESE